MESQPHNPEFKINPENFHPWNQQNMKLVLFCMLMLFVIYRWAAKVQIVQRCMIIRLYYFS